MPRLVVLEDDPVTRSMIAAYFGREGFAVREAADIAQCRALLTQQEADLLFLDIGLTDGDGRTLARELRQKSPMGIIFVTRRNSESERVEGLELGGDDYVTKPVNLRELLARARALLRRQSIERGRAARPSVVTLGPWVLDLTRRELALIDGDPVALTRAEFDLLAALVEAKGTALERGYLLEIVSKRSRESDIRTVDAIVARLRRKLRSVNDDGPIIVTVTGVGYRLGMAASALG